MQLANFFLPLSKLWKKALSPLAELQICTEKSLPIFQSRAMRCFCSYVNSDICVCREKTRCWNANHGSCLQWGVFSPSLSRSFDTTSHPSSLKQSRNCRSVHPSIGISDGNKTKVSYLLLVNFQQLWKWTHKYLWLKDHWILPQAINS